MQMNQPADLQADLPADLSAEVGETKAAIAMPVVDIAEGIQRESVSQINADNKKRRVKRHVL